MGTLNRGFGLRTMAVMLMSGLMSAGAALGGAMMPSKSKMQAQGMQLMGFLSNRYRTIRSSKRSSVAHSKRQARKRRNIAKRLPHR